MAEVEEHRPFRFSVLGLLNATALCAIAAAPVTWLGAMYAISAVVSLLLLAAALLDLRRREFGLTIAACFAAVLASGLLFSFALCVQAVVTLVVCLLASVIPGRTRWTAAALVLVMLAAYVPPIRSSIASDRRVDEMRRDWPLVSIRHRLPPEDEANRIGPVAISPIQAKELDDIDDQLASHRHSDLESQLRRLHSGSYKRFARMPGFGFTRMGFVTPMRLVRSDADRRFPTDKYFPYRLGDRADSASPHEIHNASRLLFLDRDRVGYVESIDRVAGFTGHGFGSLPYDQSRWKGDVERNGLWTINGLDLVGTVLHATPVAYVSDRLPDMETLRDAMTRPLDEFESSGLAVLRGGKDRVIDESNQGNKTHVRMIGALRAGKSCADCHDVPHGTLLGAFSYRLTRSSISPRSPPLAGD